MLQSLSDIMSYRRPLTAAQVCDLIDKSGLTKSALAESCGISRAALAEYAESGTSRAVGSTQIVLRLAYGMVCAEVPPVIGSRAELHAALDVMLDDADLAQLSDRELGRRLGCDGKTVAAARKRRKSAEVPQQLELSDAEVPQIAPAPAPKPAALHEQALEHLRSWALRELEVRYKRIADLDDEDIEWAQDGWRGIGAVAEAYALTEYLDHLGTAKLDQLKPTALQRILATTPTMKAIPYAPALLGDLSRRATELLAQARKTARELEDVRAERARREESAQLARLAQEREAATHQEILAQAKGLAGREPTSYRFPADVMALEADRLHGDFGGALDWAGQFLRHGQFDHVMSRLDRLQSTHRRVLEATIERIIATTAPDEQPTWPLDARVARAEFLHQLAKVTIDNPDHAGLTWLWDSMGLVTPWGWQRLAGMGFRDLPAQAELWRGCPDEWRAVSEVIGDPSYSVAPCGDRRWRITTPYHPDVIRWCKAHHGAWQPQWRAWRVEAVTRDEVVAALVAIFGAEPGATWTTTVWETHERAFEGTVQLHGARWGIVVGSSRQYSSEASSMGGPPGLDRGYQYTLLWRDATDEESAKERERYASERRAKTYASTISALVKRIKAAPNVSDDHDRGKRIATIHSHGEVRTATMLYVDTNAVSIYYPWDPGAPEQSACDAEIVAEAQALISEAQALGLAWV